ncbi:MAG: glycosyltransferase family 39 protein [Patescibacteria group bacterium]|nr:glycosyltransferase family 39 protein [Patescibacteria group bacterium]
MNWLKEKRMWLVVLLFLAGFGLRFYYFAYPFGRSAGITVDEAVYGDQAIQIMNGVRPVFYPAQDYTGSFSAYLSALLFAVFGVSAFWLKAVPLIFSLGTIYLIYKLALKVYGRRVALFSLLITALGTPFWNNWAGRAGTGYVEATFLGLLILLLTLRIVENFDRLLEVFAYRLPLVTYHFLALGFLSGFGFWIQPTIVYFVLPSLIFLSLNLRRRLIWRPAAVFIIGLIIGAAPVLYSNILLRPEGTTSALLKKPWGVRGAAYKLVTEGFPVLLGGRTANSLVDFNTTVSFLVYILFVLALCFFVVNIFRPLSSRRPSFLLGLFFVAVVAVFLLSSPFNQLSIEPRYVFSLYAVVPVILGYFLSTVINISRLLATGVMAVYSINFFLGLSRAGPLTFVDNYSFKPLVSYLDGKNISFAITTPAVGHRLMFFSQGQIEAAVRGGGITQARFENLNTKVTRARDSDPRLVAYICLKDEPACSSFRQEAQGLLKNLFEEKVINGAFEVDSARL